MKTTLQTVHGTMRVAKTTLAEMVTKAIKKERLGNEKESKCIMEEVDKYSMFVDAVRDFYFPAKGGVFKVSFVDYNTEASNGKTNDNIVLTIETIINSDIALLQLGTPIKIDLNDLYEFDAKEQEGENLDYFLNIQKITLGEIDTTTISASDGCPDQLEMDGPYAVEGLKLINNTTNEEIILSTGSFGQIDGTDALGDPINFNYTTYRTNLLAALSSNGINGYYYGNILVITSSSIDISNHRLESYVDFGEGCLSPLVISLSIDYEFVIELTPSLTQIPEIDETMINFIYVPVGCGTTNDFLKLHQEVVNLNNLNC